ncbi:carboxymuconolactone decarboxylase family protein [Kocuria nitroreducens]|uniref:carboxymuconolactone decarboxylase family protein n=1 Tax=Kocuria nitroreducens TaxID=3058914 RepID=UPI0036DB3BD5
MTASDHFYLDKADPRSWRALNGLSRKVADAAEDSGLSRALVELLSVRVSQLNGCAYCLDLHTGYAVEAGVSAQKLAVLAAWRETELFDDLERAALAIGEAVALLPDEETRLAELAVARAELTDEQYSALQWTAVAISAFNRVSVLSRHRVRPRAAAPKKQAPGEQAPKRQTPEKPAPKQQAPEEQSSKEHAARSQARGKQAPEAQAPGPSRTPSTVAGGTA